MEAEEVSAIGGEQRSGLAGGAFENFIDGSPLIGTADFEGSEDVVATIRPRAGLGSAGRFQRSG